MMKASAEMRDGRLLIVIGLTEENVVSLKQGEPIRIDPADVDISPEDRVGGIMIHYAGTDVALIEAVQPFLRPTTKVNITP